MLFTKMQSDSEASRVSTTPGKLSDNKDHCGLFRFWNQPPQRGYDYECTL